MKVICIHPKIHYETGLIYFRKDKYYNVYLEYSSQLEYSTQVIKDDHDEIWYYKAVECYFKLVSEVRKEKLKKINSL